MPGRRAALTAILASSLLAAGRLGADETLLYSWRLDGLLGAVAGLFLPNDGEGMLTLVPLPGGNLRSELVITAQEERSGDFFRYGAEWEPGSGKTVRAWSSQRWRGETKSKQAEIDRAGVVDVATAVQALRRDPPREPRQLEIWSDGKLYPVMVTPGEPERRRVGGREIAVRRFAVRPLQLPERRLWKGRLDLWLSDDEASTPVEILVVRSSARVRLELVGRRDVPSPAAPKGESE